VTIRLPVLPTFSGATERGLVKPAKHAKLLRPALETGKPKRCPAHRKPKKELLTWTPQVVAEAASEFVIGE
jgi:hypothetical protein